MNKKNAFKSKTLWVNFIAAIIAFFPGVSNSFTPDQIMGLMAGANILLRIVTKDKLGLE